MIRLGLNSGGVAIVCAAGIVWIQSSFFHYADFNQRWRNFRVEVVQAKPPDRLVWVTAVIAA